MSIESVMPSSHLILCCPLLLLSPIPPSIMAFPAHLNLCDIGTEDIEVRHSWEKAWGQVKGGRGPFSIDQEELPLFSEQSEENESCSKTESGVRRREDGGELSCYREGRNEN